MDTSQFSAHSNRGASASATALAGLSTKQIMDTADWSSAGTFKEFYLRTDNLGGQAPRQGFKVVSLLSEASTSRCDMEPELSDMQSTNG